MTAGLGTIALSHDCQGFGRCQHIAVAWTGVIGMAMGHDSLLDRAVRIEMKVSRCAVKPRFTQSEPVFDAACSAHLFTLPAVPLNGIIGPLRPIRVINDPLLRVSTRAVL